MFMRLFVASKSSFRDDQEIDLNSWVRRFRISHSRGPLLNVFHGNYALESLCLCAFLGLEIWADLERAATGATSGARGASPARAHRPHGYHLISTDIT